MSLIWRPNVGRQEQFLEAVASGEYYEICYGGARGGGKTDAGIMCLLYEKDSPLYRALVIRKNADDLRDWSDRADRWYSGQGAVRTGATPEFSFGVGSKIRTGHLKDENAYGKYQGHEYHRILLEELTQIPTEENYLKLAASCRSTVPELKPCIISTCNPDGAGFSWVKKRFRLHGIPTEPVITIDPVTKLKRIFIPATLADNPHLSKDPSYHAFLDGLPDGLRQAWRDGSWDEPVIDGAYYQLEIMQARNEGRIGIIPYDPRIPVHTIWDLGLSDGNAMAILFIQKTKTAINLINCYSNENFGLNHYQVKLQEFQQKYSYVYGKNYAPHDVNHREKSTGLSLLDTAKKMGLKFEAIPIMGIAEGIQKVRLLWPRMFIHEHLAAQALNALTNYRREWDDHLLRYKEKPLHDWASNYADALRYLALIEDKIINSNREPEVEAAWNYKQPNYVPNDFNSSFNQKRPLRINQGFDPLNPYPDVTG